MREEFLDKVRDTIEFTKAKTKEVANLSKLRIKALNLASEIKREYKNLGEIVYECKMSGLNLEDAIDSAVKVIADLRKQLTQVKNEIDAILNPESYNSNDEEINLIKDEIESIRRDINNLTGQE